MAKRFAIKGPKGDYRFFDKNREDTKSRFLHSRNAAFPEWSDYLSRGYQMVQVDIRELEIIEGHHQSSTNA